MRSFKIALLLTAVIAIGTPPVLAVTPTDETNRYEAFFTRELSDGFTLYSEKRHMRVSRERRGDEAVTMYDELNGAASVQTPTDTRVVEHNNPEERPIDFAYNYDYLNREMRGPEAFAAYFNTYVRPLMLKHGAGPYSHDARFNVSLAQMGLPELRGQAATVVTSKTYTEFEGRRFALISFQVPAFSYVTSSGERIVHWANGAAITDGAGGITYYLAVRNRGAASAGKGQSRPMYAEQASYATDEEGNALLDLRRFPAGKALIETALKGETGRPDYHLNYSNGASESALLKREFFAAAAGLTAIGLSVAEGSPNTPGGTGAAGAGSTVPPGAAAGQVSQLLDDLSGMTPQQVRATAQALRDAGYVAEANNILRLDSLQTVAANSQAALARAETAAESFEANRARQAAAFRQQAQRAFEAGNAQQANALLQQEKAYLQATSAGSAKALKEVQSAKDNVYLAGTRLKNAYNDVILNYEKLLQQSKALNQGVAKTAKVASDAQIALKNAEAAEDALLGPARALRRESELAAKLGQTNKAHQLHLQEVAYLEQTKAARAKALKDVSDAKAKLKGAAALAEEAVKAEEAVASTVKSGQGLGGALKAAAGKAGNAVLALGKALGETKLGQFVAKNQAYLKGLGLALEGGEALVEVGKATGLLSKGTLKERLDKLENKYVDHAAGNLLWDLGTILLSATDPKLAAAKATSATLSKLDAIYTSHLGFLEAYEQVGASYAQALDIKKAQFQREMAKFKAGDREAQARLARLDAEMAKLMREILQAKANAKKEKIILSEINKEKGKVLKAQPDPEDFEQPELPDGPGYPTLTKEQRDAISERARLRKQAKEPFRGEGDALEGIFAELDELESERIRQEELELQALELVLAAKERQKIKKADWDWFKAKHPDLTEIFGDFIENNMFDFGGMTGKGISGTVATDLSPYAEWLLGQDIKRLEAMARAAGYPNLASALNDWRNLTKKANDQGFRQWAYSMAAFSGTIDSSFSEQQHALARAQLALGDLLNDTRFIESTAGLTDLAISGTTLSTIFRDFGIEDGDNIQIEIIQFGRVLFTQTLTLRIGGTPITAQMRPGVGLVNILALNEGFASPNTAEITVQNVVAGDSVQQYSLRTGENATLRVQVGR
jgi:hypothetical protein